MATFTIDGVDQLRRVLSRMSGESGPMLGKAIYQEAEGIMKDSRPLVPKDKGILVGSGMVNLPEITPTGASVEFGYGGAASEYALVQHERMDYAHKTGGPKFLERPTLEAASGMGARLAARIQRMFRR